MPYSQFDPEWRQRRLDRFRQIPLRKLVPNVITLLALCAGFDMHLPAAITPMPAHDAVAA